MAKVSIIANFYNSKKYIPKLLKSIVNQTFSDWHLYCIDDCSPQHDDQYLRKWVCKLKITEKVTIIRNQNNLGIARAKEVGIKRVITKEYPDDFITFIDGDDWLEKDALKNLYEAASPEKIDVVISNYNRVYKLGPFFKSYFIKNGIPKEEANVVFYQPLATKKFLKNFLGSDLYFNSYWGKIYRVGFLSNLKFDFPSKEDSALEDYFFSLLVLLNCKSIKFIQPATYNWRWGGITSNLKNDSWSYLARTEKIIQSYPKRKELMIQFDCIEEKFSLLNQIKNYTIEAWGSKACHIPKSEKAKEIKNLITLQLNNPIFDDFRSLQSSYLSVNPLDKEFIYGIQKKDIDLIYKCCHSYWKCYFRPHNLRTFARWINSYI